MYRAHKNKRERTRTQNRNKNSNRKGKAKTRVELVRGGWPRLINPVGGGRGVKIDGEKKTVSATMIPRD